MVAMMGTMQHGQRSNAWFSALPADSPLLRTEGLRGWGIWLRRDALKEAPSSGVVMLLFMVPLGMQIVSRFGKGSGGYSTENLMGAMQWAIVAGIALFFFSYIFDLSSP